VVEGQSLDNGLLSVWVVVEEKSHDFCDFFISSSSQMVRRAENPLGITQDSKHILEFIRILILNLFRLAKEVRRLIFLEGQQKCLRALFHPEIASESNFDLEFHLLQFLQRSLSLTLLASLTWCSHSLF